MFFCMKYREKFLLDNAKFNYFKSICFEITKRYFFEFYAISNDDHIHLLLVLNKNILF
jgi:putative transposase